MTSTNPNDLPVVEAVTSPCRHLRSKGMYVYTDADGAQDHECPASPIVSKARAWRDSTRENASPAP